MSSQEVRHVETSELVIAAYWKLHGLKLVRMRRLGRRKFAFLFADPEGKSEELTIQWANSECHRFDTEMRSLKKLTHQGNGGG